MFKNADEILGYKISDIIFNGPQEKIKSNYSNSTSNIFDWPYAICETLKRETKFFSKKF